jgi:hypothetical protein
MHPVWANKVIMRSLTCSKHTLTIYLHYSEPASNLLSQSLRQAGFQLSRLKTGTPPRLLRQSINFEGMHAQTGDVPATPFSFLNDRVDNEDNQIPCYQTQTNPRTHDVVRANLHLTVHIREEVRGPRYCPSIESKIVRFGKSSHIIWLEPEGYDTGTDFFSFLYLWILKAEASGRFNLSEWPIYDYSGRRTARDASYDTRPRGRRDGQAWVRRRVRSRRPQRITA